MNVILIVEDSPTNLKVLQLILRNIGLEADAVNSGAAAVEAASKHRYAIILMDIMMPEMDGFEATRLIRAAEKRRGHRAAIIAVTASAIEREECFRAGMDDYLDKPIEETRLREKIELWINNQIKAL